MAISVHEKRHLFAQRLTPRMTLRTLEKHRDVLNRVRVAREEYRIASELRTMGYRDFQGLTEADRKDDAPYLPVMRPTSASRTAPRRHVPIPQFHFDPGFVERSRALLPSHGSFLFAEPL